MKKTLERTYSKLIFVRRPADTGGGPVDAQQHQGILPLLVRACNSRNIYTDDPHRS
jgi:hypothetical protein